jgi:excisionase family DNA binding protein
METANLITEVETAKSLGVSKALLYRMRKAGEIRFYKIRNRVLFSRSQIEEFLAKAEQVPESSTTASAPTNHASAVEK